jgi:hypothetical protein
MRNGSGVKATLLVDGKLVDFQLALVIDKRFSWSSPHHKLIFVTEDKKKYADGFYSGGETGFGRDANEIKDIDPKEYEILSVDLGYIAKFQQDEEERRVKEKKEYEKKQKARVEKLNALPEKETIFNPFGIELYIQRDEASYNPGYSNKINFEYRFTCASKEYRFFDPSDYFTKRGSMKLKDFEADMEFKLGIEPSKDKKWNRMVLETISAAHKKYEEKIRAIKNS